jgi:hypothetical protein
MTTPRETTSIPDPPFHLDVPGATLNGAPSTATLLVPAEQDQVFLTLGGRDEFTVSLLVDDLTQLLTATVIGEISYITCTHAVHGRVLLNVRPAGEQTSELGEVEPGPRELALTLPDQGSCRVVFDNGQMLDLVRALDTARLATVRRGRDGAT